MSLSVWSFCYRKRYYLKHPIKLLKEIWSNIYVGYMRIRYGYCYTDVWDMSEWILEVFPSMLRHMANYGCAYPGSKPFETPEKWHDWLHSMADILESLQEENWYSQNEYEKEFHKIDWTPNKNLTSTTDANNNVIRELYLARMKELVKERKELLIDTFNQLGQNFDCLWD